MKRGIIVVLTLLLSVFVGASAQAAEEKVKTVPLGTMRISAYSPESNTPKGSRQTSTGHTATAGHTIAVDMNDPICSYGKKLMINGIIYTVEDCGNLHKYGRDLDIFFDTEKECEEWGVRDVEVFLVKEEKEEIPKQKYKTHLSKPDIKNPPTLFETITYHEHITRLREILLTGNGL